MNWTEYKMNLELPLRYRTYMASCTRNFFVTLPTAHATLIYFFRHIGSVDTAMHGYTRFKPYTVADIFILQYFLGQLYCLCLWGKKCVHILSALFTFSNWFRLHLSLAKTPFHPQSPCTQLNHCQVVCFTKSLSWTHHS